MNWSRAPWGSPNTGTSVVNSGVMSTTTEVSLRTAMPSSRAMTGSKVLLRTACAMGRLSAATTVWRTVRSSTSSPMRSKRTVCVLTLVPPYASPSAVREMRLTTRISLPKRLSGISPSTFAPSSMRWSVMRPSSVVASLMTSA